MELMARKLSKPRPRVGARLMELRKAAGMSQQELADILNVNQQTVAFWEQSEKPPRSEVLPKMAKALGVKIEALINGENGVSRRGGPTGKVQRVFEKVSRMPRRQQEQIVEVVEALIDKKATAHSSS